jgi:hypothetical protein
VTQRPQQRGGLVPIWDVVPQKKIKKKKSFCVRIVIFNTFHYLSDVNVYDYLFDVFSLVLPP